MAIVTHSRVIKDGAAAVVVGAKVFVKYAGTNAKVPLFTDGTGTVPVAQPLTTIAGGVVTFFARDDRAIQLEAWNAGQTAIIVKGPIASGPGSIS